MRLLVALLLVLAACTAPQQLGSPTEPRMSDSAVIADDGAVLPLRQFLPDGEIRAVVVALHGFNDYSEAFALPAPRFTAAGIALFAYDQRGFGAAPGVGFWAGQQRMRQDLYVVLRLLAARYPGKKLFVLGESMGGAVAMTALAHAAIEQNSLPPLAGLILVAPAVWSRDVMPWYQDAALWLGDRLFPWLTLSGRGLHVQASDNIEMLRRMARDPLVIKETRVSAIKGLCDLMDEASEAPSGLELPGLVLIADRDEVVPAEASERLVERLPAQLEVRHYVQGYHMLLRGLHAAEPIGDILQWIGRRA